MAASRHAIGGENFVEETERRLAIRRSGSAVDRDLDLPRTTVPIEQIDEAVAAHYAVMPTDLMADPRVIVPTYIVHYT